MAKNVATIYNLQVLRVVAALLVVYAHLQPLAVKLGVPAFGWSGVDIFFVISGFIMVYTTARSGVGPSSFVTDRICRIVPIYWLVTLVVFILCVVDPGLFSSTVADPSQLFKSLLFIPFVKRDGLIQPVLFVGWTLNYEMFFYALFALGLAVRSRLLVVTVLLVALTLAGLIWRPHNVLFRFYTNPQTLEFALGMWIADLSGSGVGGARKKTRSLLLIAAGLSLCATATLPLVFPSAPALIVSGFPAAILVWSAVRLEAAGAAISWKWLLALGGASYSLYLTHPFVVDGVIKLLAHLSGSPAASASGMVFAVVAASGGSLVISRWVEYPLTRAARRLLAPRHLRQPTETGVSLVRGGASGTLP